LFFFFALRWNKINIFPMWDIAIKNSSSRSKQIVALHSTCKKARNHGRDGDLEDSEQIKEG
jgi:hypothetical protein